MVICFCSPGGPLAGRDLEHAVEVQVKLHDDLVARRQPRARPWTRKLADAMIVAHVVAFALVDVDLDFRLVVVDGVEDFAPRRGQWCVAVNDRRKSEWKSKPMAFVQTANAQRVRRDVHQHGADVGAGDDGRLDGGAHGHAQVRVDLLVSRLAKTLFEQLADQRRPRAAADQHDLIDRRGGQMGIVQRPLHAVHGPIDRAAESCSRTLPG